MSAWKACDIRGKYPSEVSPQLLEHIGRRIASELPQRARVLVAGDFRLSTPELKLALTAGVISGGARVLDAGQVPTPVAYFGHRRWRTDAILIVTASHNPPDHNGLKFMVGALPPTESDLRSLRASLVQYPRSRSAGTVETLDLAPEYEAWIVRRWLDPAAESNLRVVLDAGSGAWSDLAPALFEKLGFTVIRLFCKFDGRFPYRPPDCARPANLQVLSHTVQEQKADLGVAWDGDGDRVAFVSGDGKAVSTDQVSSLFARHLLAPLSGERVVYDIKLSDVLRRTIVQLGSIPMIERSGHTFLKRRMIEERCILGCEASGHYFFRELEGGDDGLFAALMMAEIVGRQGSLQSLVAALPPMFISPEMRVPESRLPYGEIVVRLRNAFGPAIELAVDGLRLETSSGFVLARKSVTEPVITLRWEGFDQAGLGRLMGQCLRALPELASEIKEHLYEQVTL